LGFGLPFVSGVDVAYEVVPYVITYVHLEEVTVFGEFAVKILIDGVKVVLKTLLVEGIVRIVSWIVVYVWKEDRLREWGSDVLP